MPRPIRVLLQPFPLPGGDAAFVVRGCTIGLQVWSSGTSLAKLGASSPAGVGAAVPFTTADFGAGL